MKRIISFILMVVIVVLHLAPCSDSFASSKSETSISQSSLNHHKAPDGCSPFCSCSCCVAHTDFEEPIGIESLPPILASRIYNEFKDGAYLNMAYSILQPPQLLS